MADEKLNQDSAPEEIENPTEEISADDLEQVSGGVKSDVNISGIHFKNVGNLVTGASVKNNQIGEIPFNKTVKQ